MQRQWNLLSYPNKAVKLLKPQEKLIFYIQMTIQMALQILESQGTLFITWQVRRVRYLQICTKNCLFAITSTLVFASAETKTEQRTKIHYDLYKNHHCLHRLSMSNEKQNWLSGNKWVDENNWATKSSKCKPPSTNELKNEMVLPKTYYNENSWI